MIREERDPAWWQAVADHPDVASTVGNLAVADWIGHPALQPFAAEHGGYLVLRMDATGLMFDLHAMFRPQGRGRGAFLALAEVLTYLFASGAQLVTAQEQASNPMSRPPLTFGFVAVTPTLSGSCRIWTLTADRWMASKAYIRSKQCLQS